ncbi:hypothetical protein TL16_g07769 [Triparma laevis f. inornata]|uniref:MYND-type domain-containing protein n=1 Tax=Triparma laevis f. inornata TaxID=1714386 RepID=A0A9W7AYM2_9STRA|nr:hypothetical protein TL16_g07769 [Triparma laevis f. inornata]
MVDFLPFQSSIISDLLGSLLEQDPELCPGINCCMVCGAPSKQTCPACNSVHYCSDKCMEADLNNLSDDEEEAQGHTPAVCKLLSSCSSPDKDSCRSELESYPSTLSNLLLSHPSFEPILFSSSSSSSRKAFQVHVVGAEKGSELWTEEGSFGACGWREAYAEALDEVCEVAGIKSFELVFVGLNLEEKGVERLSNKVSACCINSKYEDLKPSNFVKTTPDLLTLFNAGFTCPDYDWAGTLQSVLSNAIGTIPFFATSNSELENLNDVEWLDSNGFCSFDLDGDRAGGDGVGETRTRTS